MKGYMMKEKYYAIKKGKKTGIFTGNWKQIEKECITGFSNPQFKSFKTMKSAEKYMLVGNQSKSKKKQITKGCRELGASERAIILQTETTGNVIYIPDNKEHQAKRVVLVVLKGHQDTSSADKLGYFEYKLIDEQTNKGKAEITVSEKQASFSPNRAMLFGLIHAIQRLKKPCHIKVFTKAPLGFKKMVRGKEGPNSEVLAMLKEMLIAGEHVIEERVDSAAVDAYFV